MPRRTRLLLSCLLSLVVFLGVPVLLTWRAVRQEGLDRALIAAVLKHDSNAVRSLLAHGADANARDDGPEETVSWKTWLMFLLPSKQKGRRQEAMSALMWAAQVGDDKSVQALLDHGADVHAASIAEEPFRTPLFYALDKGSPRVVKALLNKGSNPNLRNKNGGTLLFEYVIDLGTSSTEDVRLLLEAGADINAADKEGKTPLREAVVFGSPTMVQLLLDHGADPNAVDKEGDNPILLATTFGDSGRQAAILRILLAKGADPFLANKHGDSAWTRANRFYDMPAIRLFKQAKERKK